MNERFVKVRHITTHTRAEAEEANRDIMSGVPWDEIVDYYSVRREEQKQFATKSWPESLLLGEHSELGYFLFCFRSEGHTPKLYSGGKYVCRLLLPKKKRC